MTALVVVSILQWHHNAYRADLSANPDEAAHFVTGLMARDYLLDFPWPRPMPFAEKFYDAYPMVAIGHWPPLFYLAQALWMSLLGGTVSAALMLMAVITAGTATLLVRGARWFVATPIAVTLGAVFLIAPIVQRYSRSVMAEMPLTLLALLAAVAYARYLSTTRARDAVWFGIAAAAAILTKPNGLALALLPPIAIVMRRHTGLVARWSFWIPAAIVAIVCGPWYALTISEAREGWSASYDPSWLLRNPVASNAVDAVSVAGLPIFVLACIGAWIALGRRRDRESGATQRNYAAAMAALAIATWIFVSVVVPVRGERHLLPMLPPMLVFAGITLQEIAGYRASRWRIAAAAVVAVTALTPLVQGAVSIRSKADVGSAAVVAAINADASLDNRSILVSSENYGEGVFIATLAARDRRPQHRVLRASRVLSTSNWDGSDYRAVYSTDDEIDVALRRMGVAAIVVDTHRATGPHNVHHRQLLDMLSRHPTHWRLLTTESPSPGFTVYRASHDGN